METCKRTIGVYLPFAKSEIQRALAYRISFFGYILGDIFQIVIAFIYGLQYSIAHQALQSMDLQKMR